MKYLRIVGWSDYFETNESRKIVKLNWVATPNGHDSIAFCELLTHANGLAHYGAWNLILQLASKCPTRGLLKNGKGIAYTARTIAMVTRAPERIVAEALERLVAIGWLEWVSDDLPEHRENPPEDQEKPGTDREKTGPTGQDRTGQDTTTTTTTGGVVDVDPEADQDDIAAVVAPAPPRPPPPRPPMAFLDWVANGHPRVHLGGESRDLWEAYWRRYGVADNRAEIFDHAYRELAATLDNPRHKVWPTNADEWLRKNYPIPDGDA
jgi:hypothetical protein